LFPADGPRVDAIAAPAAAQTQESSAEPIPLAPGHAVDPGVLHELEAIDGRQFLGTLIRLFLESTKRILPGMDNALAAMDAGEFGNLAHTLKGNAGQIGATRLAGMCSIMSCITPAELSMHGTTHVRNLHEELEKVEQELAGYAERN
jgi:HPt (histidine-containing phosphotransfer) domain-containing protein